MTWRLDFHRNARRDARRLEAAGLRPKTEALLQILREDPCRQPPPLEKLLGEMRGLYSRRINIHYRLVYEVLEDEHVVRVLSMRSGC